MEEDPKLSDILLKDPAEVTNEEREVLDEAQDSLTYAQRKAFGYEKEEEEIEKEEGEKKKREEEEKEEEKPFTLKSREEFDKTVADAAVKAIEADRKARLEAEEKEKAEKEGRLPEKVFEDKYIAPDWNEPSRKIIDRAKQEMREETATSEREVRGKIDAINKEYDDQIVEIRKSNPDLPAKGTEEGDEFERELAETGAKFKGVTDMNEAYEIYKLQKAAEGKTQISSKQKSLAGKVGKKGGGEVIKAPKEYGKIPDLDEAVEKAIEKWDKLE